VAFKLRHRAYRTVNAPPEICRACASRPESLFSGSRYVYSVKSLGGDLYEVVFRWSKLGMERFYVARLKARPLPGGGLAYESTGDSPLKARFAVTVEPAPPGGSRVVLDAEMEAGIAAGLLGRGDYRVFVEELLEGLVREALREAAARAEAEASGADCRRCLLYDVERRYCYLLGTSVEDPQKPPCRGSKYVEKPRLG